jgi:pimeloyl-ACP methyl ester carboxylesterase
MEKVTSPDGTSIAYHRSGSGSPLILVPGTGAANPVAWTAVLPALEEHFSLYAVDRRGRGKSGDSPNYSIEREFEDLAAVVDWNGEPTDLLGHSFGALCALEGALRARNIRKLILYEPAMPLPGESLYSQEIIDRLQALLKAGDGEGILTMLYGEIAMIPPDEVEQLKSSPAWPMRLATAHTIPRETLAEAQYVFDAQRFKDLHVPVLLLLGGDSPHATKEVTEMVNAALPNSQIAVMPGQQHIAMYTAPELFLHNVLTFLLEPR